MFSVSSSVQRTFSRRGFQGGIVDFCGLGPTPVQPSMNHPPLLLQQQQQVLAVKVLQFTIGLCGGSPLPLPPPPVPNPFQISTVADLARAGLPPGAAAQSTSTRRAAHPHDFRRIRNPRKPRGNGGPTGDPTGERPQPPPPECAACLGLGDGGGSTLNRYYRCRRCGGAVHGACRQFFEASEACVEIGEGGEGGSTVGEGVGWRRAVNRAGVVQVNHGWWEVEWSEESREGGRRDMSGQRFFSIVVFVIMSMWWQMPSLLLLFLSFRNGPIYWCCPG